MGNTNGKESRDPHGRHPSAQDSSLDTLQSGAPSHASSSHHRSRRGHRSNDPMLMFGAPGANSEQQPFTHKETRAEREARKLEKERALRAQERERSMQAERVDGGYLVTVGTYVGPEDFSKPVVRQLIIERRIAPFWRGLNDINESWTDAQLVAAVRGQPIPDTDAPLPPDLLNPEAAAAEAASSDHTSWLTVPASLLQSVSSEQSSARDAQASSSNSGHHSGLRPYSSHFRTRKSLAAAIGLSSSRNNSSSEISIPPEAHLPVDPFVGGKPLEVCLYRDAGECPICFLSYPKYLNHTRCCDQPICSECFVQIKRPDPSLPANHPGEGGETPATEGQRPEMLVMKPTQCPYCQQPDFGVTYDPPPFRRGIIYETPVSNLGVAGMGSHSSINSSNSPSAISRRRAQSLSANDPLVVSSDRLRPEWEAKLSTLRAHEARRSAAATALHNAAFLRDSQGRNRTGNRRELIESSRQASITPEQAASAYSRTSSNHQSVYSHPATIDDLDDMMMAQALRLSILSEEQRRRKAEKEIQKSTEKEAKKREKEERKKKRGSFYPLGFGSHGSSSQQQSRHHHEDTEHSVGSGSRLPPSSQQSSTLTSETAPASVSTSQANATHKGKGVDHTESSFQGPLPGSSLQATHIGQASSSSSPVSSVLDMYPSQETSDMHTSSTSVDHQNGDDGSNNGGDHGFNFRSLAEIVGIDMDKNDASRQNNDDIVVTDDRHMEASSNLDNVKNAVSTTSSEHSINPTSTVS
ncbi:hypothetical protein BROUX41_003195 [Berkeleyomyces rouxiae]